MDSDSPVSLKVCSFTGRSGNGRSQYAFISGDPLVRRLWSSFAQDCTELDSVNPGVVRAFLHQATSPAMVELLRSSGEAFLLEPLSLKAWFLHFKRANVDGKAYFRRGVMFTAIYAVRYMMDLHPEAVALSDNLVAMIRSREIATFLLDHWTGEGVVGVARASDGSRTVMREFVFHNADLARLYCRWFESGIPAMRVSEFADFADEFEESLGEDAASIRSFNELSETTLLRQTAFFRRKYLLNPTACSKALRHVIGFYRYVVNTEEGCHIFDDSNFSPAMLRSKSIMRKIAEGWEFQHYRGLPLTETRRRLVVLLRDVQVPSTRYVEGEAVDIDFSVVESEHYRNLLWRYVRTSVSNLLSGSSLTHVADALHRLEEAKRRSGRKPGTICESEGEILLAAALEKDTCDATTINELKDIRCFFDWAIGRGYFVPSPLFTTDTFFYRSNGSSESKPREAMPVGDLDMIRGRLAMESEKSDWSFLMLTFLRIQSSSSMRPSQICQIDIRKIFLNEDEGYCVIYGISKVSHGDKDAYVTQPQVYRWIQEAIARTAELRSRCVDPAIKNLLFLNEGATGIVRIKEGDVKADMARVCEILGLDTWTPYNVRTTFGTVAEKLFGDDAHYAMNHKSVKTTREHYVDLSFEQFRETGDIDAIGSDAAMEEEYGRFLREGRV
jgi:integrase